MIKCQESEARAQNQRKTVRRIVKILRKALDKFQTDLELSRSEQLQQTQSSLYGRFVLGGPKKLKELKSAWRMLPVGERDARRRPWRLSKSSEANARGTQESVANQPNEHWHGLESSRQDLPASPHHLDSQDQIPKAADTQVMAQP